MSLRMALITALALLTVNVAPVRAHHSASKEFDVDRATTIQGVITKVEWMNPHVSISIDVKSGNGSISTWRVEASAPNALYRAGIRLESFELSKPCTVQIWPARDGSKMATGRILTYADGRNIDISDRFGNALMEVRP